MDKEIKDLNFYGTTLQSIEDEFIKERDSFWLSLTKEQQLLAFCAVVKKLSEGELKDKLGYRDMLYEKFEFEADSYMKAQISGFIELHNAIKVK